MIWKAKKKAGNRFFFTAHSYLNSISSWIRNRGGLGLVRPSHQNKNVALYIIRYVFQFLSTVVTVLECLIPNIFHLLFSFLFVWFKRQVHLHSCFDITDWLVKRGEETTISIFYVHFHITITCRFHQANKKEIWHIHLETYWSSISFKTYIIILSE